MSYKVKPEDVPDELVRHYLSSVVGDSWKHKIAADINAAIEAGLVSPPCWIARATSGQLISGTVYPSREHAEQYKWPSDKIEHWKGQTE